MVVCKHTPGGNVRYLLRLTPIAIDIQFLPSADLQSCKLVWRLREIRCVVSGLWACFGTSGFRIWQEDNCTFRMASSHIVSACLDEDTTKFALDSLHGRRQQIWRLQTAPSSSQVRPRRPGSVEHLHTDDCEPSHVYIGRPALG